MSSETKYSAMFWKLKRALFWTVVRVSNRVFGKDITHRSALARRLQNAWSLVVQAVSPSYRRQRRFEAENPAAPWFVPEAVSYLEQKVSSSWVGFEWGCGRSTLWFARRVRHITSIEGRKAWHDTIARNVAVEGLDDRVTLSLAEVTSEYNVADREIDRYAGAIDDICERGLDFIVIDGHFREACLGKVDGKLKPGGLLIVDNSEVLPGDWTDRFDVDETRRWNNGIWETTVLRLKSGAAASDAQRGNVLL